MSLSIPELPFEHLDLGREGFDLFSEGCVFSGDLLNLDSLEGVDVGDNFGGTRGWLVGYRWSGEQLDMSEPVCGEVGVRMMGRYVDLQHWWGRRDL